MVWAFCCSWGREGENLPLPEKKKKRGKGIAGMAVGRHICTLTFFSSGRGRWVVGDSGAGREPSSCLCHHLPPIKTGVAWRHGHGRQWLAWRGDTSTTSLPLHPASAHPSCTPYAKGEGRRKEERKTQHSFHFHAHALHTYLLEEEGQGRRPQTIGTEGRRKGRGRIYALYISF